jgi:hypothetical protein
LAQNGLAVLHVRAVHGGATRVQCGSHGQALAFSRVIGVK